MARSDRAEGIQWAWGILHGVEAERTQLARGTETQWIQALARGRVVVAAVPRDRRMAPGMPVKEVECSHLARKMSGVEVECTHLARVVPDRAVKCASLVLEWTGHHTCREVEEAHVVEV